MTIQEHQQHLLIIIETACDQQLAIRHQAPGDLAVIGCDQATKPRLADLVALAGRLHLRVKWCNEGTLVAIGIPTQKPGSNHGKKGSQETTEGGPGLLCSGGAEGRLEERSDESPRPGKDEGRAEAPLG